MPMEIQILVHPTDFNEKTVKTHSPDTLTRAAKQTWSQSFTLRIQIPRPWGRTFQSNSPLSGVVDTNWFVRSEWKLAEFKLECTGQT